LASADDRKSSSATERAGKGGDHREVADGVDHPVLGGKADCGCGRGQEPD
jgi:hypothetical protein